MRFSLIVLSILATLLMAQTPLEFGIVQDLVGGTPRVSVFSIKTINIDGLNTLQIAVRGGIQFDCSRHSMTADSVTGSEVIMNGQICYSTSIMKQTVEHIFSVIRRNMSTYGSGGITQFQIELITFDEMGWVSVTIPLVRVDSLLAGTLTHQALWTDLHMEEVEVGTGNFAVIKASPLPELHGAPEPPAPVEVVQVEQNHSWKSLVLPGWGQASADRGVPVVNILVEVGGAVLLLSDDYREAGIAVLATNHLISFFDLF